MNVLVIEEQMKQYRLPFYLKLNEALRDAGIRLTVAYSDTQPAEAQKKDNADLPGEFGLKVKGFRIWPSRLLYQPLLRLAMAADLVIIDQGNRFILNHLLLPLSRAGMRRVAFWGNGENRQAGRIWLSEWYRRKTLNWVCWWFAYTKGTAKYLEVQGVPASKITAVQNSVDTREITECVQSLTPQDRTDQRARLGIPETARVGIFCGVLDKVKAIPFLIESSRIIRSRCPDFHLIIAGGGPERDAIVRLVDDLDWVHCVGPRFGSEKAKLMAISDAFLLPGKVGLAILDAFAADLPMVTTRFAFHAPEIEYLDEGVNGLMSDPRPEAYAKAVSSVLSADEELSRLRAGAKASAEKYSIENMVANFRTGIRFALESQPWTRKPQKELLVRSE